MTTESDFLRLIQRANAAIEARNHEKAQLEREIQALKQSKSHAQESLRTTKNIIKEMERYDNPSTWTGCHAVQFRDSLHRGGKAFASARCFRERIESSINQINAEILRREIQKNDLGKLIMTAQKNIVSWKSSMNALQTENAG